MKKLYTLISLACLTTLSFGQTQRIVLAEEFSNASCGPCASQNPAFNTLLSNNTTKVVSVKYQTNWPGTDPMNAQTQTEVGPRVSYYGVNGVPYAPMDGSVANITNGSPSSWNQTKIDARYAVASPFSLNMTHSMSPDFDSVFISVTVTASVAATYTGPLKLHVVMVEKAINFATAPGTNGEKNFYSVMRKMYPNASGTSLPLTWTVGQAQTVTFERALPTYIYNKSQIAIVGFIQDDSNKDVKQAGITTPIPVQHDAGVSAIGALPLFQCNTTINPTATVKNYGTATLTSATVKYQVDNGTIDSISWTGSLAPNATATVSIPAMTVAPGSHTLKIYTVYPNSTPDYNGGNNTTTKAFNIIGSSVNLPLTQDFQLTTFPPNGWMRDNPDNAATWSRRTSVGGFAAGTGTAAAKMDFYNSPSGQIDDLFPPALDISNMTAPIDLTFDVSYAQYSTENDKLEVMYSTNCGSTWTAAYTKSGATLATAPATTSSFLPTATQWRTETVSLNNAAGNSQVLLRFKATSNYGNNMYIDNINLVGTPLNIKKNVLENLFSVYPNPANENPTIFLSLLQDEKVVVEVYNLVGELLATPVNSNLGAGEHMFTVETSSLPSGLYCVKMTRGNETITKKITLSK